MEYSISGFDGDVLSVLSSMPIPGINVNIFLMAACTASEVDAAPAIMMNAAAAAIHFFADILNTFFDVCAESSASSIYSGAIFPSSL